MGDGIWEGGLEDGDGFDFHARAFRQGGDGDAGAGRGIGAEGFTVYAVHDLEFGHVHDELIIECSMGVSLDAVCEQMGRTPPWIKGLNLRADGYETMFYKKD